MHYLLFYEVSENYVARRAEFRAAHLEKAWQASKRGELVLGGALADPVDGAVLLFKGDSPEVAEKFARADPYVTSGTVKRWYVREWTTVAGEDAAKPMRPAGAAAPSKASAGKSRIVRQWKGRTTAANAERYIQHLTNNVFPELRAISGYRAAYLLRRKSDGEVEFVVLTLWDSMDAIRKFAGTDVEKAVVAPQAQAVLSSFDEFVSHYEVVKGTDDSPESRLRPPGAKS
ncbi:MAG TPA: YciI-like protein [Terriglobales bacterium]|nr:YciI-like protein [Terriglobales bacterium]